MQRARRDCLGVPFVGRQVHRRGAVLVHCFERPCSLVDCANPWGSRSSAIFYISMGVQSALHAASGQSRSRPPRSSVSHAASSVARTKARQTRLHSAFRAIHSRIAARVPGYEPLRRQLSLRNSLWRKPQAALRIAAAALRDIATISVVSACEHCSALSAASPH